MTEGDWTFCLPVPAGQATYVRVGVSRTRWWQSHSLSEVYESPDSAHSDSVVFQSWGCFLYGRGSQGRRPLHQASIKTHQEGLHTGEATATLSFLVMLEVEERYRTGTKVQNSLDRPIHRERQFDILVGNGLGFCMVTIYFFQLLMKNRIFLKLKCVIIA